MASTHEALYRRFKADESAQFITGPYRQLHPYDNNERQAIHEHGVTLAGAKAEPPARYTRSGESDGPPAASPPRGPVHAAGAGPASAAAGGSR